MRTRTMIAIVAVQCVVIKSNCHDNEGDGEGKENHLDIIHRKDTPCSWLHSYTASQPSSTNMWFSAFCVH